MGNRSGGRVLVDGLIKYGVERIFCVPGESYLAALDAFYERSEDIAVITCRQEGGAAYMAEAHGKLIGQPGICFASRGPGASNAMIGIHTAFQDSTPVILFVGQVARRDTGREAFQELDYRQVYAGVAKKVIRIDHADRIPELLAQAWNVAISGRPGPVVVELPEDMLIDSTDAGDLEPMAHALPAPAPKAMAKFGKLISSSEKALVLCGGAGWTPRASKLLQQFSENQCLPVATVFRRTDSFDNTHPHYIGELGIVSNPGLVKSVQQAELLIVIGPRLGDITTAGYTVLDVATTGPGNSNQDLVHVHIGTEEINSVYQADLGIVSQPELFLEQACEIPAAGIDRSKYIASGNSDYVGLLEQPRFVDAAVRLDLISAFLRERLPADAIVTNGAGNYAVWAQRNYQFRKPGTQLASTNGSMGYGVPAAIAGKLHSPDSMVVSWSGDGCFLMNGQELATAVQYELNIMFLVVNNSCYGTIRSHQDREFPGRQVATHLDNPDFAALGKAYGAFGAVVTRTEDFEPAFDAALASGKPAVIEIQTDYY
jgi:acetolactate synthase-1/2/3 large subunit